MTNKIFIEGIAAAVPSGFEDSEYWSELFGREYVERVTGTTGISSVRRSIKLRTSDLCQAAASTLLSDLKLQGSDIDTLIFVSQTPNASMPATSCALQAALGLPDSAFSIDVPLGCSGYPYGLILASSLLAANQADRVLLLAGDVLTPHIDPSESATRMVFGDGGSATLVTLGESPLVSVHGTDGLGRRGIYRSLPDPSVSDTYVHMDGTEVMRFALSRVPGLIRGLNQDVKDVYGRALDIVFLHQANAFIVRTLARTSKLESRVTFPLHVDGLGNTGPASIPLAICEGYHGQSLGLAGMVGFGVGWSWAGVALDLSGARILPRIDVVE